MISGPLLRKELRESRWKIIIGLIIFVATAVSIPLLYNFIREIFTQVPPLESLGMAEMGKLLEDYNSYVWSQWSGKNLYQIGAILAIITGMNLISGEKAHKTLEFLLTRPVSRSSIYLTKFLGGIISLGVVVWASTAVLYVTSITAGHNLNAGRLLASSLISFVGLIFIFSLTLLLSSLLEDAVRAGLAAALCTFILAVPGWFESTGHLSIFYHMRAVEFFFENKFPFLPLTIMLAFAAAIYYGGLLIFKKAEL